MKSMLKKISFFWHSGPEAAPVAGRRGLPLPGLDGWRRPVAHGVASGQIIKKNTVERGSYATFKCSHFLS